MKSMSYVMLQAHFKELRKELEKAKVEKYDKVDFDLRDTFLKRVYNYLKAKSGQGDLDKDGMGLLVELARLLDNLNKTD